MKNEMPIFLLAMLLLVSACSQKPASVLRYGVSDGPGSAGEHTVLPGETVYGIAENYRLPMRDIIRLNNIEAPFKLKAGARLKLPPPREYRVRRGDSVSAIARLFDVSQSRLASLNDLSAPYRLQPGQTLRLPAVLEPEPPPARPRKRQTAMAPAGRSPAPVTRESLGTSSAPSQPAKSPPDLSVASVPSSDIQPESTNVRSDPVIPEKTARKLDNPLKPAGDGSFMRPVEGPVISTYGPKADGLHNDGINIRAKRGTAVRAAQNGSIVYVGDDLAGYGNLVLIRHADNMMSAYAHLDKTLVERGADVVRGESIGTVGATGSVDSPQLHFELRKGSRPIDPTGRI